MKRTIGAILGAFALLLVILPAPAQAVPPPGQAIWTNKHCDVHTGGADTKVCVQLKWEIQDDGDGAVVKGAQIDLKTLDFVDPCYRGTLPGALNNPTVKNGKVSTPGGAPYREDTFADMTDCDAFRTVQVRGADTGSDYFLLEMTVNRKLQEDFEVFYWCDLYPGSGTSACNIDVG